MVIKSEERSSRRLAATGLYMYRSVTSVQFTGVRRPPSRKGGKGGNRNAHGSDRVRPHSHAGSLRESARRAVVPTLATGAQRRSAAGVLPGAHWRHCAPLSVPSLVLHSCAYAPGTSQLKRSGPIDGARCNQGSMKVTFRSKAATAAARTSGGMPFRRPSKCSSTGVLPE